MTQPDLRHMTGPFDIIGDVHGCADELEELLAKLGYPVTWLGAGVARRAALVSPPGRRAVFVGDLVDRGPRSPDVLAIVMAMCRAKQALCVPGNHDAKFLRWLAGRPVRVSHGLGETIEQTEAMGTPFRDEARAFLEGLPTHLWLAGGRLAVAHAGITEERLGSLTPGTRAFCLYGDTSGETDGAGLPVRYHWAAQYRGETTVVYGHTPVPEAGWVNNTLCIDTGCVFGGALTALRWPEREIVSVVSRRVYFESKRQMGHPPLRPADRSG